MNLPVFRYHPDPIASGSIVASDERCDYCETQRGFIYQGPVYCERDPTPQLCPWCIADGSAHAKFDASFNDTSDFPDEIRPEVAEEVAYRTPSFIGWQQEHWLTCCGDAAAFLESVGYAQICARYPELEGVLTKRLAEEFSITSENASRRVRELNLGSAPIAHVFACLHCGARNAYVDYD